MKKLLLAFAVAGAAFAANAADITEDWTALNNWEGFPTTSDNAGVTADYTSPSTGVVYNVFGCYRGNANAPHYLMINSKKYDAHVNFTLPINCSSIDLKTTSSCSENAKSLVDFYANDELVQAGIAVNVHNATVTVLVPAQYRAAGTVYSIRRNNNGYNQQFSAFVYHEETSAAAINLTTESLTFATVLGAEQTQTITGTLENITTDATVSVNNSAFTVPATISAAELAAGMAVKFTGATAGMVDAVLTISAQGVTAEVELSASVAAHAGTEADPLTVSDVQLLNNGVVGPYCVIGTIAGCAANVVEPSEDKEGNPAGVTTEEIVASNIALAEEGVVVTLPVQLPSGAARTALNLVDNPTMLGRTVVVSGTLEVYFSRAGVKNTTFVRDEGGENPPTPPTPPTGDTFKPVTTITSGSDYVLVVDEQVAKAISATVTYGRLSLVNATFVDGNVVTDAANAITITTEGTGYTMKDANNRYLGFDPAYSTSFQLYTEANANCIWDIAMTNSGAAITMTIGETTCQVGVTKGTNGTWFNNVAPSVGADEIKLPKLYEKDGSSKLDAVTVEATAPVEYFNLQGVRVENPQNGLYIRRQGSTVTKVYVR